MRLHTLVNNPLFRHGMALLGMVAGVLLTIGSLVVMHRTSSGRLDEHTPMVQISPVTPKPKPQVVRRRPKPKPKPRSSPPPAAPNLTASLAGLSFGLPGFEGNLFADSAESLIGKQDVVMTKDSVDEVPTPAAQPACDFPRSALVRAQTGSVTLSLLIMPNGSVQSPKVLEADPPGVFDATALECVRSWRYNPATYQGAPVKLRVQQTLRFELE